MEVKPATARSPLRVWVLSDGQPGHYNQSRGILSALRRIRPVQESWIRLELRVGLARNLLRFYLNRVRQPAALNRLRLFYRIDDLPEGGCDLIVSTGGKTSFANAWLGRALKVPNLYAGSLRRLSPQLFSVVITLEPVEGAASNLVVPLPPSAIDYDALRTRGQQLCERLGLGEQPCWTLLLGGNGAGFRYHKEDWLALCAVMETLAEQYGIRWLIASSRRTGRSAEQFLRRHLDRNLVAAQCWYGAGDQYDAEAYLGAAERVFVTEDSVTMLTEAICSRRPVYSLRPRRASPNRRYRQTIQRFSEQGLLCRYALAALAEQPAVLDSRRCEVLKASPLEQLADQLGRRLALR